MRSAAINLSTFVLASLAVGHASGALVITSQDITLGTTLTNPASAGVYSDNFGPATVSQQGLDLNSGNLVTASWTETRRQEVTTSWNSNSLSLETNALMQRMAINIPAGDYDPLGGPMIARGTIHFNLTTAETVTIQHTTLNFVTNVSPGIADWGGPNIQLTDSSGATTYYSWTTFFSNSQSMNLNAGSYKISMYSRAGMASTNGDVSLGTSHTQTHLDIIIPSPGAASLAMCATALLFKRRRSQAV